MLAEIQTTKVKQASEQWASRRDASGNTVGVGNDSLGTREKTAPRTRLGSNPGFITIVNN